MPSIWLRFGKSKVSSPRQWLWRKHSAEKKWQRKRPKPSHSSKSFRTGESECQPGTHSGYREGPPRLSTPPHRVERPTYSSCSGANGVPPTARARPLLQACGVQLLFVGRGEPGGEGFYCWDSSLPFFWQGVAGRGTALRGGAGLGAARSGRAGHGSQGRARHVQVGQGTAWLGSARQARQSKSRLGLLWLGMAVGAWHGKARFGWAWHGGAWQARQGRARLGQ
jgi:hypothetical protein